MTVDSLRALVGGLGDPLRDKSASTFYSVPWISDLELLNAYRGAWLPKKIVNIPAFDATRRWRQWNAEKDQITTLENEEKRLDLRQKVLEAKIKARLFGGAAIFIGTVDTNLAEPLDPARIGKQGIKYLIVLSKYECRPGPIEQDVLSENFNKPQYYTVNERDIHPSRLVRFVGSEHPEMKFSFGLDHGWGDSVLYAILAAIKRYDGTAANIASLVFEANVDVFKIPDFLDVVGSNLHQQQLIDRFALTAMNKAVNRSLLMGTDEEFDRKPISFGTLDKVLQAFQQDVCGAADIPATRLFGMSPSGLSATGESDLRNYYDGVSSEQEITMRPALSVLDECLIRSALGTRPADVGYLWASLWQKTDKERADIGKINAETVEIVGRTGLVSQEALSKSLVNRMVEDEVFPGLDQAVEDDPVDFEALLEEDKADREASRAVMLADAEPRPLYVYRSVTNAKDIVSWAKSQGFATTLFEEDLHVTIVYSKQPVDWFKVGEPWSSTLIIPAGGPRMVEQFDGGAIVLHFAARELEWRWQAAKDAGASSSHAEYSPHITISYRADRLDLETIEPYSGEIHLGPEIFKPINTDWKRNAAES